MKRFLQFLSWPVVAGTLFAVILLQYQQIDRLSSQLDEQTARPGNQADASTGAHSWAEAVDRSAAAVVSIHSTIREEIELPPAGELPSVFRDLLQEMPSERLWDSLGSGVAVSDEGHILTARHVIEGAEDIEVHFSENAGNTTIASADVVGSDPSTDLALLKVDSNIAPPRIPIGSSDNVRVGDPVMTIGYPRRELMNQKSVSEGIVSALGIPRDGLPVVEYIQTDAAMNYGNSGGALLDDEGNLIGINSFIYSQSGSSEGIGFAVPVNKAMMVVDQLIQYGEVRPGYLGVVTGEMLTNESSENFFGRPDIEGLLIEQVDDDSPAESAGLQPGDVLTAINGRPIESVNSAIERINRKPPGEQVNLTIYREGEYRDITVELGTGQAQYRTRISQ